MGAVYELFPQAFAPATRAAAAKMADFIFDVLLFWFVGGKKGIELERMGILKRILDSKKIAGQYLTSDCVEYEIDEEGKEKKFGDEGN